MFNASKVDSGRRGGTGCCCCCCCVEWLASALLCLILKLVVIVSLIIIVCWLIFRHQAPRFNIDHASLQLMLPPRSAKNQTNDLRYNLAVNMSIRNPNHFVGIYYDGFESKALFSEQRSGAPTSNFQPPFFQHAKNTTNLHLVFKGLNQTMRSGNERFDVTLKVHLKMRVKLLGVIKVKRFNSTIECDLNNTTSSLTFGRTRCHFDFK